MDKTDIIIITGASQGLGLYLESNFSKHNLKVVGLDIQYKRNDLLPINSNPLLARYNLDIQDKDNVNNIFEEILVPPFNNVTLINNACPSRRPKNLSIDDPLQISLASEYFNIMVIGSLNTSIALSRIISKYITNSINLINIINIGTHLLRGTNSSDPIGYTIAKASLYELTRQLAIRLSPKIKVNQISPGVLNRPGLTSDETLNSLSKLNPTTKHTEYNEIYSFCRAIHAGNISGFTGQNFFVDGGLSILDPYYAYNLGKSH